MYGIVAVGAAFLLSLGVLWHFVEGGGPFEGSIDWFTIGPLHLELGILVDGLTGIMLVVVTSISLCVHIYSLGYMHGDERFTWFYVVLSLFTAAMLTVVVSNNLIQLLVGWEIMGVCSYLLIGHWWEVKENSNAAIKAFITTRVGDIPFMFGIIMLIAAHRVHHHEHHRDLARARPRRGLPAVHLDGGDPAVRRHRREVGAVPAARVAARRDGGPHARLGADPRGHDGGRRRLPDRPALPGVPRRRTSGCSPP